ncbi:MAG: helix-turn-helix domain-containing protein [Candidatus Gracilibacteria bacterium]|nr:helix-turn-helix domain-containing protein [Candidatus Gracilibacteria bacterium]
MYGIDRVEGSKLLNMSTRTIDRYIRNGKIRSKKVGKKIFLHNDDVEILKNGGIQQEYEIINSKEIESNFVRTSVGANYKDLYDDSKKIIEKKDEIIKDLSYRLGNVESELKNSIPLIEYKKATFLLESSTTKIEDEKKELNQNIDDLSKKISSEKKLNIFLLMMLLILITFTFIIWFKTI